MSHLQWRVLNFHQKMGQKDPVRPVDDLSTGTRVKRARLIMEEAMETCVALIGGAEALHLASEMNLTVRRKRGGNPGGIAEIADGCVDTMVVAAGTLLEMGISDDQLIGVVMDANDAKVGGGKDEHSKFLKPPGWLPPNVAGEIEKQRNPPEDDEDEGPGF